MATGLFNLKQINQATQQSAWPTPANYVGTFDGSTQYLFTPTSSNLTLGTGDFTIECWVYIPALATRGVFQTTSAAGFPGSQSGIGVYLGSSGNWNVYFGGANYTPSATFSANQWMHIAVCRSSTTSKFFINGVSLQSITDSTNYTQSYFAIGGFLSTSYLWAGQITNFRVLKGTALYTTDFAPPTNRLTAITNTQLLTLQDSTIVDNSANNFTLTNTGTVTTSLQYPFSSFKTPAVDYLVVAGGAGAGASAPGGGGAGGLLIGSTPVVFGSAITVTVGAGGSGTSGSSAPGNGTNSVFGSQIAIGGGKGGNNGIAPGSGGSGGGSGQESFGAGQGTVNQGFRGGQTFQAGGGNATSGGGGAGGVGQSPIAYNAGGQGGNGLGSVITGTMTGYGGGGAGTTGNTGTGYSIPGAAYGGGGTAAAPNGGDGTVNTGGAGSGAGNYTGGTGGSGVVVISYPDTFAAAVSTTGSPTVSTSGAGCIAFTSASNQYLLGTANSLFQFGTGDFTWETWVYQNISGSYGFYSLGDVNASGSFGVFTGATTIYVRMDGNSGIDLTYVAPNSVFGNWVHLAVVRQSGTMTLYYNGTAVASGSRTQNLTQQTPYIGNLATLNYYLNGNLSNFRVVKGTAVYTANFTPSTTPLQKVTNTSLLLNANSGSFLADSSGNGVTFTVPNGSPSWNASSPFTVPGYKNRVYRWTSSGSITF